MTLYDINREMLSLIDAETGEIADYEKFSKLQMERETKIENTALWIKNLLAEAEMLKKEKDAFAEREKAAKNKAESLKKFLVRMLEGNSFSTTKVALSFKRSESTEVEESFIAWAKEKGQQFLTYSEPKANLTAIKQALKEGQTIPFASLSSNLNLQIK